MIDLSRLKICLAQWEDSNELTPISFAAKRSWHYPEHYYDLWKDELTIFADYITKNLVYKAEYENSIIGFYSVVENKSDFYSGEILVQKGFWMDHLFIRPDYQRLGIGRLLVEHAKQIAEENGILDFLIFVDPYARGFYERVGAKFLYNSKSSIPGRLIPVYNLSVD